MLAVWWVWIAGGLAIGIIEVVVPGYIFVGFAIGAVLTGVAMGLGLPGAEWMMAGPGNALTVFGLLSLAAWLSLRRLLGVRHGQAKRFDHDIND
jgi:membrane protein implicated in regulation of membrane protease activity